MPGRDRRAAPDGGDDDDPGSRDGPHGEDGRGSGEPWWPVAFRGVTESIVATRGPEGRWNLAALGLRVDRAGEGPIETAGEESDTDPTDGSPEIAPWWPERDRGYPDEEPREGVEGIDGPVTARTWGQTRTRINFEREGGGVVQFSRDPLLFVEAALGIVEREEPVDPGADAWVHVSVDRIGEGTSGGTGWVDWRLVPVDARIRRRTVPTVNRGYNAVVEATVAASRVDVDAYDAAVLLDRLAFLEGVVEACGSPRDRSAFERIDDHVGWRDRR